MSPDKLACLIHFYNWKQQYVLFQIHHFMIKTMQRSHFVQFVPQKKGHACSCCTAAVFFLDLPCCSTGSGPWAANLSVVSGLLMWQCAMWLYHFLISALFVSACVSQCMDLWCPCDWAFVGADSQRQPVDVFIWTHAPGCWLKQHVLSRSKRWGPFNDTAATFQQRHPLTSYACSTL